MGKHNKNAFDHKNSVVKGSRSNDQIVQLKLSSLEQIEQQSINDRKHITKKIIKKKCQSNEWNQQQSVRCYLFLLRYGDLIDKKDLTDKRGIYNKMQRFIGSKSKTKLQCNDHIKKAIKQYNSLINFIHYLKFMYCWGNPTFQKQVDRIIELEKQQLQVQFNLFKNTQFIGLNSSVFQLMGSNIINFYSQKSHEQNKGCIINSNQQSIIKYEKNNQILNVPIQITLQIQNDECKNKRLVPQNLQRNHFEVNLHSDINNKKITNSNYNSFYLSEQKITDQVQHMQRNKEINYINQKTNLKQVTDIQHSLKKQDQIKGNNIQQIKSHNSHWFIVECMKLIFYLSLKKSIFIAQKQSERNYVFNKIFSYIQSKDQAQCRAKYEYLKTKYNSNILQLISKEKQRYLINQQMILKEKIFLQSKQQVLNQGCISVKNGTILLLNQQFVNVQGQQIVQFKLPLLINSIIPEHKSNNLYVTDLQKIRYHKQMNEKRNIQISSQLIQQQKQNNLIRIKGRIKLQRNKYQSIKLLSIRHQQRERKNNNAHFQIIDQNLIILKIKFNQKIQIL